MFAAGGIGVTPWMNAIGTARNDRLLHEKVKVKLIWVVQDFADTALFSDALKEFQCMFEPGQYSCHVYATKVQSAVAASQDKNPLEEQVPFCVSFLALVECPGRYQGPNLTPSPPNYSLEQFRNRGWRAGQMGKLLRGGWAYGCCCVHQCFVTRSRYHKYRPTWCAAQ